MRFMICFIVSCLLLCQPCLAMDRIAAEVHTEQLYEALPEELAELLESYDLFSGEGWAVVWEELKDMAVDAVTVQMQSVWKPAVQVLMVVVLCSVLHGVFPGDRQNLPLLLAGSAAIISLTLADTKSFFHEAVAAVQSLYDFSTALLPCMAGASVIAGATVSAGVKYTAAALFMNLLLNFCNSYLIPSISVYLVCVIGETVFDQKTMGAVADLIRRLCITVLTGGVVLFTSYMGVVGLLTTSGDVFATRFTRTALSAGLPIVGKILSDTASTLVAGASLLRSGIGVFGMLAVLGILIVPFASMGIRYLMFKAVGELVKLFPNQKFSGLVQGIATAFGIVIAVLGTGFIMIFMTVISFMQMAGGV